MGNSSAFGKGFTGLQPTSPPDRVPIPEELTPVENPQTLATAIKIGSPVSWKKVLRSVIRSHAK
jgi:threonine synthase